MQREIKFRGKRLDNGEWVYGNLLKIDHGTECACYIIPRITNGSWSKDRLMLKFISPCYEVDPETIGEYTGFCDENGKEICESDIVELPEFLEQRRKAIVVWSGGWYWKVGDYRGGNLICASEIVKIIGNPYDNPELLEATP